MQTWRNNVGLPLASDKWLEAHHQAKLEERTAFARLIAEIAPTQIVDLGCGTGLWLDLLAHNLPSDCELFGIDIDKNAVKNAQVRAEKWYQKSRFECLNLESSFDLIPESDIYLAFNILPYVANVSDLLEQIRVKIRPGGYLIIRQYDGALLRMGPMDAQDRTHIDNSLMTAMYGSEQFKHYDLDRVFSSITSAKYRKKEIDFETFKRVAPYPPEFIPYFINTTEWMCQFLSEDAANRLKRWLNEQEVFTHQSRGSYFIEVDMVAWLS